MSDFIERLNAFESREKLPRDSTEVSAFPALLSSSVFPTFLAVSIF